MDKFYTYFRSSAAYRVRIALALKGVAVESLPVNLRTGEQHGDYAAANPQALVPALCTADGVLLSQSLVILEYLEQTYPNPPLLPSDSMQALAVKSIAYHIACDIHPLNNLRVLNFLKNELAHSENTIQTWYAHWVRKGFSALEKQLANSAGKFCFDDAPTLADCCLIPQVYNAKRYGIAMEDFPIITRIYEYALTQPAFIAAKPENQADFVE
ncbi:maleylacetoacetate isomerase [Moraxella caviae]|uniref:Maleylacetoacetate isomerase n=1 Tax=Moraxella caviae TaxID=34060 RepID=A0A1T0A2P8_9GAMM|nr:maleylacetoacetate isomerase [Moraxella caviae]OOR89571.1 maleylacetoacetate isomerase [Moraxella caviae]STZ10252.1 Stringent starvation protein A homolog [Moraxella caviae]VEW13245.1 Stringent starvation protein A homolog [Moraxella caviae]